MTEPYELGEEEEVRFDTHRRPPWIERVRAADAEAEAAWRDTLEYKDGSVFFPSSLQAYALAAIAAELRAQRIARRPGAGQK